VIAGPTQSAFFSLTVRDPVVISNFPATTGVAEGDPIVLNLGHGGSGTPDLPNLGTPAFTYTWERNDGSGFAPIAGAPNAAQITLPAAAPADNGVVIRVTVANSFSSAQAATTIAVVNPSVRTQPQSRTVLAGTAFSLEVEAGGSPEGRTFQWKRGKTNLREGAGITGVTTSVLQIANVDLAQAGDYSCEIRNAFGVRLSDPAFVTVVGVPGTMVPVSPLRREFRSSSNGRRTALTCRSICATRRTTLPSSPSTAPRPTTPASTPALSPAAARRPPSASRRPVAPSMCVSSPRPRSWHSSPSRLPWWGHRSATRFRSIRIRRVRRRCSLHGHCRRV
jgi:hypothetical protein